MSITRWYYVRLVPLREIIARLVGMTCSKCSDEAVGKHGMCPNHWAEYQRDYRQRADKKRERAARDRGFLDGVAACCQRLRQSVGTRAITGNYAAQWLEVGLTAGESAEIAQRRAMLQRLSE
jgi:hypothetical protein